MPWAILEIEEALALLAADGHEHSQPMNLAVLLDLDESHQGPPLIRLELEYRLAAAEARKSVGFVELFRVAMAWLSLTGWVRTDTCYCLSELGARLPQFLAEPIQLLLTLRVEFVQLDLQ